MSRSTAAVVLAATARRWDTSGDRPVPRPGWLCCPVCGTADPVLRFWQFHVRPGLPTVPWRCDVGFKCRDCAALWLHGVALDEAAYDRRPRPVGLRDLLTRASSMEPRIFAGGVSRRG